MLRRGRKSGHGWAGATLVVIAIAMACSAVAYAQPVADWQSKWEKVLAEAKKEGNVVVFGPPGELVRKALIEGFKNAFPEIEINFSGATGSELASKVRAEREGGIFSVDVLLQGTSTVNVYLKPMEALDPIAPALILPKVTDTKNWRDQRLEFSDKEGKYNVVFASDVYPVAIYNSRQAKAEEINDPFKLLDSKWKGKIVVNDPLPSGPGNGSFRWIWRLLGPARATDFYRKIRAQVGAVDRDQRRQIEWIVQGKYAILLGPNMPVASQLAERGLKLDVLPEFRDYGTYITSGYGTAVLINRAPHPNAATVFLNWVLSREGQTAWSKAMGQASRRLDVPSDHVPSYLVPKPGARTWTKDYKAGDRYWLSYHEEALQLTPEQEKLLKELFGR